MAACAVGVVGGAGEGAGGEGGKGAGVVGGVAGGWDMLVRGRREVGMVRRILLLLGSAQDGIGGTHEPATWPGMLAQYRVRGTKDEKVEAADVRMTH